MNNETTVQETLQEAKEFFVSTYNDTLTQRLREEFEEEGDLDNVVKGDADNRYVDGSFLTGVDEVAYVATISHFAWRLGAEGKDLIDEMLRDSDVYEGVDYQAIIKSVEMDEHIK